MQEVLDPIITDLNRPFWDAAEAGRLVLPHCFETGRFFWPPSPVSPFHPLGTVDWRAVEPVGTILSIVIYERPFQRPLAELVPYGVALVELAAGPRLLVHVADPSSVQGGERVCVGFASLIEGSRRIPCVKRRA